MSTARDAGAVRTRYELPLLLLAAVAALALFLAALHALGLEPALLAFLRSIEATGLAGEAAFALVVVLAVPLLVPTVLLTLGAGALYGLVHGTLLIVTAETLGALISFALARHVLGARADAWLERYARVRRIIDGVGRTDWRLVALLRMIPFFPFKVANYLLGLTPLAYGHYALGTWLGLLPVALFNVHLGAVATELLVLGQEGVKGAPRSVWLDVAALGFTACVTVFAARRATRLVAASA